MEIIKSMQGNWPCLAVTERLDTMTAPELEKAGLQQLDENAQLVIDFAKLSYISSAGLRTLLLLGKKAKKAGGSLVLCGAAGMVQEILEESGLSSFFVMYEHVEELP